MSLYVEGVWVTGIGLAGVGRLGDQTPSKSMQTIPVCHAVPKFSVHDRPLPDSYKNVD